MRSPVIKIQCWWRQCMACRACRVVRILIMRIDEEILAYWRYEGIENAPDYAKDLFANMLTPRC